MESQVSHRRFIQEKYVWEGGGLQRLSLHGGKTGEASRNATFYWGYGTCAGGSHMTHGDSGHALFLGS